MNVEKVISRPTDTGPRPRRTGPGCAPTRIAIRAGRETVHHRLRPRNRERQSGCGIAAHVFMEGASATAKDSDSARHSRRTVRSYSEKIGPPKNAVTSKPGTRAHAAGGLLARAERRETALRIHAGAQEALNPEMPRLQLGGRA